METVVIVPGVTTAGDNIPLPASAKDMAHNGLQAVVNILVSDGTATGSHTNLTVIAEGGSPATGEVAQVDRRNIKLGDNTTALNALVVTYISAGEEVGF